MYTFCYPPDALNGHMVHSMEIVGVSAASRRHELGMTQEKLAELSDLFFYFIMCIVTDYLYFKSKKIIW